MKSLFAAGAVGLGAVPLIWVGVGYFLVRMVGKYVGSALGCRLVGSGKLVQRYLGLALIPQAGVAIGLAELGSRIIKGEMGEALLTIILASSVLYELIGPAAAKFALYMSHSYGEWETIPEGGVSVMTVSPDPVIDSEIYVTDFDFGSEVDVEENTDESSFDEAAEEYFQSQFLPEVKKKKSHKDKDKSKKDKKKKDKGKGKEKKKK